jgi:hypothetical protein
LKTEPNCTTCANYLSPEIAKFLVNGEVSPNSSLNFQGSRSVLGASARTDLSMRYQPRDHQHEFFLWSPFTRKEKDPKALKEKKNGRNRHFCREG